MKYSDLNFLSSFRVLLGYVLKVLVYRIHRALDEPKNLLSVANFGQEESLSEAAEVPNDQYVLESGA